MSAPPAAPAAGSPLWTRWWFWTGHRRRGGRRRGHRRGGRAARADRRLHGEPALPQGGWPVNPARAGAAAGPPARPRGCRCVGWFGGAGVCWSLGCKAEEQRHLAAGRRRHRSRRALLDRIEVEIKPARGQGASHSFPLAGTSGPPFRLAVVPEGDPALEVEIVARAMLASREVVKLAALVRFDAGAARETSLLLSADCIDSKPRDCPGAEQCVAGGDCLAKRQVATLRPLGTTRTRRPRCPTPRSCPMLSRARWTPSAIARRATWAWSRAPGRWRPVRR